MKLGIASTDWARTLMADNGLPAMGGSGWIRLGQYLSHLTIEDTVIGVLSFHHDTQQFAVTDWNQNLHIDLDVLVVQRYMNRELVEDLRKMRSFRDTIIVQDVDDWYWGIDPQNHAWKATHPKFNPTNNTTLYKKVIHLSDYVIVSTPFLADKMSAFTPSSKVILHENYVDIGRYSKRTHTEADRPLIGWFGSTGHRSGDLKILRGVLSSVEDSFGFVHVGDSSGANPAHPAFSEEVGIKAENMAQVLPLLTHDELVRVGFDYDIGIVPLVDKPFNHAKSWIKGLEFASARIPFVASPSPEYKRFQETYGVGRIARSPSDWVRHLKELRDPELREEEAEANFKAIQPLDVSKGAESLEAILRSLV